jgi:hypothetical protein
MNEESKRRLTNFLEECWHELSIKIPDVICSCGKVWRGSMEVGDVHKNRTFTTPADYFAVFDRLVELKRWRNFIEWVCLTTEQARKGDGTELMKWLLSKTNTGEYRLCWMVGEWRKEGKG